MPARCHAGPVPCRPGAMPHAGPVPCRMPAQCHAGPVPCRSSAMPPRCHAVPPAGARSLLHGGDDHHVVPVHAARPRLVPAALLPVRYKHVYICVYVSVCVYLYVCVCVHQLIYVFALVCMWCVYVFMPRSSCSPAGLRQSLMSIRCPIWVLVSGEYPMRTKAALPFQLRSLSRSHHAFGTHGSQAEYPSSTLPSGGVAATVAGAVRWMQRARWRAGAGVPARRPLARLLRRRAHAVGAYSRGSPRVLTGYSGSSLPWPWLRRRAHAVGALRYVMWSTANTPSSAS